MCNVAKFYGWLANNETTPIEMKLRVLDNCMFPALLYGCEAWGEFSCVHDKIRKIEKKALKAILKVKSGTTNDLVYYELRRGDIVAKIKDWQYRFYQKVSQLPPGEAIVTHALSLCKETSIVEYYENLHDHHVVDDCVEREERIRSSTSSMIVYYVNLVSDEKSCIYDSFLCDEIRFLITRWRLSNHDLQIEKGRRRDIPREQRVCDLCETLEDEEHVIFQCPRYVQVRQQHQEFLERRHTIELFLNPTFDTAIETSNVIREIEALRKS